MSKPRVFIVHGWGGSVSEGWLPWMKKQLEKEGCTVRILKMPHTQKPTIRDWVATLQDAVKKPTEKTFFVGHSIGCQTILRYLETLSKGQVTGGALFVAPFFTLKGLETTEEKNIARPWLDIPIDVKDVKSHIRDIYAIFSDNDPFVPLKNRDLFETRLHAWTLTLKGRGHLSEEHGVTELPEGLAAMREMLAVESDKTAPKRRKKA